MASSQDSSSDSSTSSPQHPYDGATIETENTISTISPGKLMENFLPGVMMSTQHVYARFFCQLYQLGCDLSFNPLRDGAWSLLQIIPCDTTTMDNWVALLMSNSVPVEQKLTLDQLLTKGSPSEVCFYYISFYLQNQFNIFQVLYNLEVLYAMLMPALDLSEKSYEFQYCFMTSGFAHLFLEMLTKNNFMSGADNATKRAAYLVVLKISKLILTSIAHVLVRLSEDHTPQETEANGETVTTPGMFLKNALRSVPGHSDHVSLFENHSPC